MTNSARSLSASADIAETMGRTELAKFYREMARDALAMETHFPGSKLYATWAKQAEDYLAKEHIA